MRKQLANAQKLDQIRYGFLHNQRLVYENQRIASLIQERKNRSDFVRKRDSSDLLRDYPQSNELQIDNEGSAGSNA
jgi:hypothetical protein